MPLRDEGFVRSAAPLRGVSVVVLAGRTDAAAALRAGLAAATGGCLVLLDGPASVAPAQIEGFVDALEAGAARLAGAVAVP
jgi:hypothetical protein